jgi:transposase
MPSPGPPSRQVATAPQRDPQAAAGQVLHPRADAHTLDDTSSVKPHTGKEIHVVLDNLSTHTTPQVKAWLAANPNVTFHFTPVGSSWLNQIEIWFGNITRQSIRRGTFPSVTALIARIRD